MIEDIAALVAAVAVLAFVGALARVALTRSTREPPAYHVFVVPCQVLLISTRTGVYAVPVMRTHCRGCRIYTRSRN